jgi:hypothetical protein
LWSNPPALRQSQALLQLLPPAQPLALADLQRLMPLETSQVR